MSSIPLNPTPLPHDEDDSLPDGQAGLILIGKLAEIASVAPSAIRFYEKEGLLAPRKLGRLRTYSATDVNTLHLIVRLRKTGLPVNKVREVLSYSKADILNGKSGVLTKIIEKQVEELLQMNEVVGEQINCAMKLLRELDETKSDVAK